MAIPTFNLNLNIINACDADDWDGGAGSLDTVIFKQNGASLSVAVRDGGTAGYTHPATSWDMSGTDTHIRMWMIHTFVSNLETKALGGIQLYVKDTSNNYNYYYVSGSDTHSGAWELLQADLANPDVDGSANLAVIEEFGWELVHATAARNITNTWWDYAVYGTGYEVIGGTDIDRVTWATLAAADLALGYGVVTLYNGVYFANAEVILGDTVGTGDLYFDGSDSLVVFYNANESATLYKIVGDGNGTGTTDIVMDGTVIKSDSNRFVYDMNATNVGVYSQEGTKLDYAGLSYFKSGQSITNSVFNNCNQIDPGTSTFTDNNITNSVDTGGAALFPTDGSNFKDLVFLNNDNAIEYDATSDSTDPGFDNLQFDDVGAKYDVNNTSGGSVTITLANTSNANSYNPGGDLVTFSESVQLTMTVYDESAATISGVYAYIDDNNETPFIMNTVTDENGEATVAHTGGSVVGSTWRARKYGYKPYRQIVDISTSNITLPVTMIEDPQQT
jgi:hypothetical protein